MVSHETHLVALVSRLFDLDVDISEEDVMLNDDRLVQEVHFSKRVHKSIDDKLANLVIARILGSSIGYKDLLGRVQSLWNPAGEMHVTELDNGYYLIRFASEEDFSKVLISSPWIIYGCYLTVQPWSLPFRYYTRSLVWILAGRIRKFVKIDYNMTEEKRGHSARMMLVVNLNNPITICYVCARFGHSKEGCTHIALSANIGAIFSIETTCGDQANETIMKFSTFQPNDNQTVEYGPRMHVSGSAGSRYGTRSVENPDELGSTVHAANVLQKEEDHFGVF
ncbi:hypothetical protein GQ457_08G025330 [Hibiscus cannabinus]